MDAINVKNEILGFCMRSRQHINKTEFEKRIGSIAENLLNIGSREYHEKNRKVLIVMDTK